jgi:FdhD protein
VSKLTRSPSVPVSRLAWHNKHASTGTRVVANETPIALTYNRATLAVMLATPADLEDFAVGFSLTEGIIEHPDQVEELSLVEAPGGIELRMWLPPDRAEIAEQRRRRIAGPSGCGLCGIDSLHGALPPVRQVTATAWFSPDQIAAAVNALPDAQRLNHATHAVHAAGFWHPSHGLLAVREDVGRHNALDKLAGALARQPLPPHEGVLLLSSRLSIELIQKAAVLGVGVTVAVSAPTALAIRIADAAGMTVIAVARQDGFEVFTHPERLNLETTQHVPG